MCRGNPAYKLIDATTEMHSALLCKVGSSSAARRSWELRGDLAALSFIFGPSFLRPATVDRIMFACVTPATTTHRRGFTLVESLIAVSLTTLACGALLTTIGSTVQISTDSTYTVIAQGMADQLMDEMASVKFPHTTDVLTMVSGTVRAIFNNLDDYNGWNASPPQTRDGMTLGTERMMMGNSSVQRPTDFQADPRFVSRFRQQVTVEKIAEDTGGAWIVVTSVTPLRRVTVTISYTDARNQTKVLAVQTRVFSDVAVAP